MPETSSTAKSGPFGSVQVNAGSLLRLLAREKNAMNSPILKRTSFAAIVAATTVVLFATSAMAASFQVLHSFSGPEGETPAAPLIQGTDGFLYGVAAHGGDFTVLPPDGGGAAFRMDASGSLTTLHTFRGPEGATPNSLIQARDGLFYGTTSYGGQPTISSLQPGTGTIFRMNAAGTVTVLHVFSTNGDGSGAFPGPIVQGADGALYGSAAGGVPSLGVYPGFVYRFDPVTGDFRHLHDFAYSDGKDPTGPLFQAADGFFYGTTNEGGPWNSGVIYKVDSLGHFALLHSLSPFYPGEGAEPKGGVIQASDGFFYGTTEQGTYGGEIFRMDAAGNFAILHRFDAYASDGWRPVSGLIEGRDGFLYGTAPIGGQPFDSPIRYGVVYRMDKAGTVTVMHTFTGPDGASPWAALVQGADGQLYGSTVVGGASGLGVLFRLDPASPPPPPPPAVSLKSLTLNPTQVSGGSPSTGAVALSGAAPSGGGVVVALTSSNPSVAGVPASVTVPQGGTNASFAVTTTQVSMSTTVNISATYAGITKTATLTVKPPVTADTVAITLAQYRSAGKKLSVHATSTSAAATLTVYVTATGQRIGTLANNGGGRYSAQFSWPSNPQNITVRSSLGGSATTGVAKR